MRDRPLSRRLLRLAAPALWPGRAHRADLWPGLAIGSGAGGAGAEVRWRGRPVVALARVSRIVPPGRDLIAVVGSGPSLAGQEPGRLPAGAAILLNGALGLAGRVAPLAGAIEDERFVHRHGAMVAGLPPGVPLLLSAGAMRALLAHAPAALDGRPTALIDDLRKPVGGARRALADPALDPILWRDGDAALSRDPDRGVVIAGTVALTALQAALAARPRRILLAGIDLGNAHLPRFYETPRTAAPSGLAKGLPRILAGFALALAVARAEGIAIACASPASALLALGYPYDGSLA